MSLLHYEQLFSSLRMNIRRGGGSDGGDVSGGKSPHKVALLLAVIELIENGQIAENRFLFDQQLRDTFTNYFNDLAGENDKNNPHLPFFHLRSSGFWHHQVKPGRTDAYAELTTASGPGAIDDNIAYAYIDDELFELLNFSTSQELLRTSLYENLSSDDQLHILRSVDGWDWLECEAIVQDYFEMLLLELSGIPYSKAEHRRLLQQKLNNRSEGSIEYKHQNISAVLTEMGQRYIDGYKPAFNYQSQLRRVVIAHLAGHESDLNTILDSADKCQPRPLEGIDWTKVLDPDRPERLAGISAPERNFLARKINFAERESRNRSIGENGEAFVLEFEKFRLREAGRADLAKEVEWRSKEQGDGLGYDIRSFSAQLSEERFIEVKTTSSGKYQSFFLSENELAFSRKNSQQFALYRVYNFSIKARIFWLPGAIDGHVNLYPQSYRASFSK